MDLVFRKNNDANYEDFKSSGKIEFIEKMYNLQVNKIIDLSSKNTNEKDMLIEKPFKTLLNFTIQFSNNAIKGYQENIKLAKEIILKIDSENK